MSNELPISRLLLTGATGNVGAATRHCLLRQQPTATEIVVASRHSDPGLERLGQTEKSALEVVPFDFTKPETIAPALRGVTGLLLVRPPAISDMARYLLPVVQAAVAAGVQQVVFLSLQGAQYNPLVPHHKVEGYLKESGLRYSLLRPSFFMQNLSTTHRDDIRRRNQLLLPAGHARTSFVDAADVGAVAAKFLLTPPATSAGYELTSREALTYDESALAGRLEALPSTEQVNQPPLIPLLLPTLAPPADPVECRFLAGPTTRWRELRFLWTVLREFLRGFRVLHFVGPCVTVFGLARVAEDSPFYTLARQLGAGLSRQAFTVLTGGGPGIMEAASRGAREAGGPSIGCTIVLPEGQHPNPYLDT